MGLRGYSSTAPKQILWQGPRLQPLNSFGKLTNWCPCAPLHTPLPFASKAGGGGGDSSSPFKKFGDDVPRNLYIFQLKCFEWHIIQLCSRNVRRTLLWVGVFGLIIPPPPAQKFVATPLTIAQFIQDLHCSVQLLIWSDG